MVVSISNLYSFEICIIYKLLGYDFVLLRHFKNHLSTQNIVSVSSKISLFDPVLLEGTSAMTTPVRTYPIVILSSGLQSLSTPH